MSYTLLRLRVFLKDTKRHLRWAWQRLSRGWDDRVVWSIDYYLCETIPEWLTALKEQGSHPASLEQFEWHDILDNIIEGFKAGKYLADDYFPIHDEVYTKLKTNPDLDSVEKLLNMSEIEKEQRDYYQKKFDQGWELFRTYFFNLWC